MSPALQTLTKYKIVSLCGDKITATRRLIPEDIATTCAAHLTLNKGHHYIAVPTTPGQSTICVLLPGGRFTHAEPMPPEKAKHWMNIINNVAEKNGSEHIAFEVKA